MSLPHARTPESRAAAEVAEATSRDVAFWCFNLVRAHGDAGCTPDEMIVARSAITGKDEYASVTARIRDLRFSRLLEPHPDKLKRLTRKKCPAVVLVVSAGADFANFRTASYEVPLHRLHDAVLPWIEAWRNYLRGEGDDRQLCHDEILRLYNIDPHREPEEPPPPDPGDTRDLVTFD